MLPDEKRKQLDDIVVKMAGQNAPKADVEMVVNDFKSKYSVREEPQQKQTGFIQSVAQGLAKPFLRLGLNARNVGRTVLGKPQLETADAGYLGQVDRIKGPLDEGATRNLLGAAGVGLEAGSNLVGGTGAPGVVKTGLKGLIKQGAKEGAKVGVASGGLYGLGSGLQKKDAAAGSVLADAATGAALGAAGGSLIGATTPLAVKGSDKVVNFKKNRQAKIEKQFDDAIGNVLQGEKKDKVVGREILSSLDTDDIKTYQDLRDRTNEKIEILSNKLDEALETNPNVKTMGNLALETQVGSQTVKQNYVADALDQLEDYYQKTNNPTEGAKIKQIREKAEQKGLSVKEVNQIAKIHGKQLSAYNVNGQLASGLSKQAAENTRSGLKATARKNFGNEVSGQADEEISKLIRVRTLADDMVEKVNDLQQRIQERGLLEKFGRIVGQVVDMSTGGFLGGATRSLIIPRGGGLKIMNALDLEKNLQKNLKLIREAADPKATENDILKKLNQIIVNGGGKPQLLQLPPRGGTSKVPESTIFVTPKGKAGTIKQEVSDTLARETNKVKTPKGTPRMKRAKEMLEPYMPPTDLPTIR